MQDQPGSKARSSAASIRMIPRDGELLCFVTVARLEPRTWGPLGRSLDTKLDPQPTQDSIGQKSSNCGLYFRRRTLTVVSRIDKLRSREGICGEVEVLSKALRDESGIYIML